MMKLRSVVYLTLMALLLTTLLAACPLPTPPTPPTATPAPPTATPIPGTPTPEGWVKHETPSLIIWLPAAWETLEISQENLDQIFANFQTQNPDLAKIIGSAEALRGVFLWAFYNESGSDITDNLNIRKSPLDSQKVENLQETLDAVTAQYNQIGFTIMDSGANLTIGGQPAAWITYSFDVTDSNGQPITVEGHQYFVATATDLWILSYTIGPGQSATLESVIAQSAQSFRAK